MKRTNLSFEFDQNITTTNIKFENNSAMANWLCVSTSKSLKGSGQGCPFSPICKLIHKATTAN